MAKAIEEGHLFPPFGDWKTGKKYPDPKKADYEQWAWEFLRRNPKYQKDWQMVEDAKNKMGIQVNILNPENLDEETPEEYFCRFHRDEDYCLNSGEIDWEKVHPHPSIVPIGWGLEGMLDPRVSQYKIYGFINRTAVVTQWLDIGGTKNISMEPYETYMIFDLRKDIKTSLGIAEKSLKEFQDTYKNEIKNFISPDMVNKRKRPSDNEIWIEWLRILDAKQSEATNAEIKSAKIADTQNLKEKFKRAKEFRDKDYRLLAEDISPRI